MTAAEMDTELPSVEWLIEGILPARGVCVLWGQSTAGKSFLGMDWGGHVATGRDWFGHAVKQGCVVYTTLEDEDDYTRRRQAWERHTGLDLNDYPWHFDRDGLDLLCPDSVSEYIYHLGGLPDMPALIIVDTLTKAATACGRNEKGIVEPAEMARAVDAAQRIADATGGAVVLLHHSTKRDNVIAGAATLSQGVRAVAHLSGEADGGAVLTLTYSKLKPKKPGPLQLTMREVQANDKETALVVVEVSGEGAKPAGEGQAPKPRERGKGRQPRMSGNAVLAAMRHIGQPATPVEVAERLKAEGFVRASRKSVHNHLKRLIASRDVRQVGTALYALASRVPAAA